MDFGFSSMLNPYLVGQPRTGIDGIPVDISETNRPTLSNEEDAMVAGGLHGGGKKMGENEWGKTRDCLTGHVEITRQSRQEYATFC